MKYSILLTFVLLAGCGSSEFKTNGSTVMGAGGSANVQEVVLSDGTRCAVLVGYQKGAISCDWNGSK